jgi:small subunit ribosomal protein S13
MVEIVPQKTPIINQAYFQKSPDFRSLLRMIGTSIEGYKPLYFALSEIRGMGRRLALAICRVLKYDPDLRIGLMADADLEKIEKCIKDPVAYGIPHWMVNRQKDRRTGEDRHVSGTDIELVRKMDIDRMKRMKSWKGIRHMFNLKVRGQHTRTTGRSGLVVGYLRTKKKSSTAKK